jgi:hypothetical protein
MGNRFTKKGWLGKTGYKVGKKEAYLRLSSLICIVMVPLSIHMQLVAAPLGGLYRKLEVNSQLDLDNNMREQLTTRAPGRM